jgi:osmoprotectant transport system substrate-binding protein
MRKARPGRLGGVAGAVGLLVGAASLTGCGTGALASTPEPCRGVTPGTVEPHALDGVTVRVGATKDDQSRLLRRLTVDVLCAAGADVVPVPATESSLALREQLLDRAVDVYWAHLDTAWTVALGHDEPIHDAEELYREVRTEDLASHGVVWGPLAPVDPSPTFVVRDETARAEKLSTDSDMAAYLGAHPGATVCMTYEFAAVPSGYPGFTEAYGIAHDEGDTEPLPQTEIAEKVHEGECDFGQVPATDTRSDALGLTELEDDKGFFLPDNPAPTVRDDTARAHPKLLPLLAPLAHLLTTQAVTDLDEQVSVEGRDPATVAEQFLRDHGLLA